MHKSEERFKFGDNWRHFLSVLNDDRIREAESSLKNMLEIDGFDGRSFIDIGSGSGLFSLWANGILFILGVSCTIQEICGVPSKILPRLRYSYI